MAKKKKRKSSKSLWDRIRRNPSAIEDILGGIATMVDASRGPKKVTPNREGAKKSGLYSDSKVRLTDIFKPTPRQ